MSPCYCSSITNDNWTPVFAQASRFTSVHSREHHLLLLITVLHFTHQWTHQPPQVWCWLAVLERVTLLCSLAGSTTWAELPMLGQCSSVDDLNKAESCKSSLQCWNRTDGSTACLWLETCSLESWAGSVLQRIWKIEEGVINADAEMIWGLEKVLHLKLKFSDSS